MMVRVFMLGWEFPPHNSGGLGVACRGLARALSKEAAEILFVLPKKINISEETLRIIFADIPTIDIAHVDTALAPYVSGSEYERWRHLLGSDIYGPTLFAEVARYAKEVAKIARRERFDVIHAHDWLSFLAGIEAKRVSGKPLVVHDHATAFDQAGGEHADPRVYAIEKAGLEQADAVIAVSHFTKNIIVNRYGISAEKVHVIWNGIDASDYGKGRDDAPFPWERQGQKMVLYVGRLTMHKGPDYFLNTARRVLEYRPDTIFVISGSGDMEWQLVRQATDLGISDKVFFAGFNRGDDLTRLYRSADLFVLPSVSEPFGLTPLESLVNGTPVLLSKQSGVSEVLKNALKVDFWDTDEMANQIIAVLRDGVLHRQLTEYGLSDALGATWERAAAKVRELYHSLVGKKLRISH